MATYTVEEPQSKKKITFMWDGKEPPSDNDIDEIFKEAKAIAPDKIATAQPNDMPWYQKAAIGMGKGMLNVKQGIQQRTLENIGRFTPIDTTEQLNKVNADIEETRKVYEPLATEAKETPWYQPTPQGVGQLIGESAPTVFIPGGAQKNFLPRLAQAMAVGAGQGYYQPTTKDESILTNTLLGGAVGGIGQGVLSAGGKLINTLKTKLPASAVIRQTLGEITNNPHLQRIDTWLEQVPLLGNIGFRKKQLTEANRAAENAVAEYIANPTSVNPKENNKTVINNLYDSFRQLTTGKNITTEAKES